MTKTWSILLVFVLVLVGCTATKDGVENFANRTATGFAKGKKYSRVASWGEAGLARVSADPSGYGPMIGASSLVGGDTLYRHIAPAAKSESSSSFVGLVGSSTVSRSYRLSYFRVGPDGIVGDWATGTAPGTVSDCINFIGGIIQNCDDVERVRLSLSIYDSLVKTSDNRSLSSWGVAPQ